MFIAPEDPTLGSFEWAERLVKYDLLPFRPFERFVIFVAFLTINISLLTEETTLENINKVDNGYSTRDSTQSRDVD